MIKYEICAYFSHPPLLKSSYNFQVSPKDLNYISVKTTVWG